MRNGESRADSYTSFFIKTLKELDTFFNAKGIEYAILGGLAAGAWGISRATYDIDIVLSVSKEEYSEMIRELGKRGFKTKVTNPEKSEEIIQLFKVARHMTVRVDIMLALIPYQLEALKRRVYLKVFNIRMPVLTPEDMIIHKLISNRPIDVQDVEHIFKL